MHSGDCQSPATQHIFYSPNNPIMISATEFTYLTCTVTTGKISQHLCTNGEPGTAPNCVIWVEYDVGTCSTPIVEIMGIASHVSLDCIMDPMALKQYTGMQANL